MDEARCVRSVVWACGLFGGDGPVAEVPGPAAGQWSDLRLDQNSFVHSGEDDGLRRLAPELPAWMPDGNTSGSQIVFLFCF